MNFRCFLSIIIIGLLSGLAQSAVIDPYGVCAHVSRPREFKNINKEFKLMKQAGIKWVRTGFTWSKIEPKQGQWNFQKYDKIVEAAKKYGIKLIPNLDYHTPWSGTAYKHLDKWHEYVKKTVTRYKDYVHRWEIWNEPNNRAFWNENPSPKSYIKLLKETYTTIKHIDPQIKIIHGGLFRVPFSFIKKEFKMGALNYCDIFAIHPYSFSQTPEDAHLYSKLNKLRKLTEEYDHPNIPIIITEIGWSSAGGAELYINLVKDCLYKLYPKKRTYTIGLLKLNGFPSTYRLISTYLKYATKNIRIESINLKQLKSLNPNNVQILMFPRGPYYPGEPFLGYIVKYVRHGGYIAFAGGIPMYYKLNKVNGKWINMGQTNEGRIHLHIAFSAWWTAKNIPRKIKEISTGKNFKNILSYLPNYIGEARFLTDKNLKAGDKKIPIITGKTSNYSDTLAALYNLKRPSGGVIASTIRRNRQGWTEKQQAKLLPRSFLISRVAGIKKIFWYDFYSREGRSHTIDRSWHFGLVHHDLLPKPVYHAYATLIKVMPPGSKIISHKFDNNEVYIVHWKQPRGKNVYAVWSSMRTNRYIKIKDKVSIAYNYLGIRLQNIKKIKVKTGPTYIIGSKSITLEK